jgi:hypothetical protein
MKSLTKLSFTPSYILNDDEQFIVESLSSAINDIFNGAVMDSEEFFNDFKYQITLLALKRSTYLHHVSELFQSELYFICDCREYQKFNAFNSFDNLIQSLNINTWMRTPLTLAVLNLIEIHFSVIDVTPKEYK